MTEKVKEIVHHLEWAALLFTIIGGFYILDAKIERKIDMQSQRTDRLYEMFIDLLKERK